MWDSQTPSGVSDMWQSLTPAGIFRKFGTDAHVWIPGVGSLNGAMAANYVESTFVTGAAVDGVVGGAKDNFGGIHATQATTANKPLLRQGAKNLLTYSEDFSNAAWSKNGILTFGGGSTVNAVLAPNGTMTADKYVQDTSTTVHRFTESVAVPNVQLTASVYVKMAEIRYFGLKSGISTAAQPVFDLLSGTVVEGVGSIENAGNGWYRCSATVTPNAGVYITYWTQLLNPTFTGESYTGDGVSGLYIWGAQIEVGSTASPYIPTTTAPASAGSGKNYWAFDGVNDYLSLDSVPFQMADDHCMIACVRPIAYGTNGRVFEAGSAGSEKSRLYIGVTGLIYANLIDAAGTARLATVGSSTIALNECAVLTLRHTQAASWAMKNSVSGSGVTTALSTSTFTGMNIATGFPTPNSFLNGNIYCTIAIKGTVTDAELKILERWAGLFGGVAI